MVARACLILVVCFALLAAALLARASPCCPAQESSPLSEHVDLVRLLYRRVHADCRGVGSDACLSTGFLGRLGALEHMQIEKEIKILIAHNTTFGERPGIVCENGMKTMRDEGERVVPECVTTPIQLERVNQASGGSPVLRFPHPNRSDNDSDKSMR
jgi:type II secretory ATPase GspE/PulE/Tfp pilus assembly ATPase PilB-like protein